MSVVLPGRPHNCGTCNCRCWSRSRSQTAGDPPSSCNLGCHLGQTLRSMSKKRSGSCIHVHHCSPRFLKFVLVVFHPRDGTSVALKKPPFRVQGAHVAGVRRVLWGSKTGAFIADLAMGQNISTSAVHNKTEETSSWKIWSKLAEMSVLYLLACVRLCPVTRSETEKTTRVRLMRRCRGLRLYGGAFRRLVQRWPVFMQFLFIRISTQNDLCRCILINEICFFCRFQDINWSTCFRCFGHVLFLKKSLCRFGSRLDIAPLLASWCSPDVASGSYAAWFGFKQQFNWHLKS